MDRLGDLLRVRATRSIGVRQDHDVPVLEVLRQSGIPFGRGALGGRRGHEADLGEGIGVFLALAEIDQGRDWGRDQLRQPIRDFRAIRLPLGPAVAVPVILRELLLARLVAALADLEKALAVLVEIDVLGEHVHLPPLLPAATPA